MNHQPKGKYSKIAGFSSTNREQEDIVGNTKQGLKGFTEKLGIDYEETFSPVVKFGSIRSVLEGINMQLAQFDVKTAFLNRNLTEDVYMTQLKGYEDGLGRNCKLQKALYGFKQSANVGTKNLYNI